MAPPLMPHISPIASDAGAVGLTASVVCPLGDTDNDAPPRGTTDIDGAGDAATAMRGLDIAPTVSEADGKGVTVMDRQAMAITD